VRLLLIRHGATPWTVTGQHTGRSDVDLSEEGRAQVARLAPLIREHLDVPFDDVAVFSSPLRRAIESARIAMGGRDLLIDQRLIEYDYGDCEGLTPPEVRERMPGWDIWEDGCPGGEQVDEVGERVGAFVADVERVHRTAVVFAHSHVIRIMAAVATGLDARDGRIFTLDTASLSVIDDVRAKRVIQRWNVLPSR